MANRKTHLSARLKSGLLAAALTSALMGLGSSAQARDQAHAVYQYRGNQFIIRKMPAGHGRVYLYAYRRAGDQWEEHSIATVDAKSKHRGNSIPELIYSRGRYIGRVVVDLDNPLNTDLNKNPATN